MLNLKAMPNKTHQIETYQADSSAASGVRCAIPVKNEKNCKAGGKPEALSGLLLNQVAHHAAHRLEFDARPTTGHLPLQGIPTAPEPGAENCPLSQGESIDSRRVVRVCWQPWHQVEPDTRSAGVPFLLGSNNCRSGIATVLSPKPSGLFTNRAVHGTFLA